MDSQQQQVDVEQIKKDIKVLFDSIRNHQHKGYDGTQKVINGVFTRLRLIESAILGDGVEHSGTLRMQIADGKGDCWIAAGTIADGDFSNAGAGSGFIMGIDDSDSNKVKFYFGNSTNNISYDGTTLTITGAVSATTGTIGGFNIGADYIRDAANSMGLASTVTGGDDVRFWAGDTFANRATAPFRVTESGATTLTNLTVTGTTNQVQVPLTITFTAGENLTAGKPVFVEDTGADVIRIDGNSTGGGDAGFGTATANRRTAESFSLPASFRVSKVTVWLKKQGTPADNAKIGIQAVSAGNPSGVFLGSGTLAGGSITGSYANYTFTLDAEVEIAANTTYFIVAERTGATSDTDYYNWRAKVGGFDDGTEYDQNSGSVWSQVAANDVDFQLVTTTVAGRVYTASGLSSDTAEGFVGFVQTAATYNTSATIAIAGVAQGLSGLSAGTFYKLADGVTAGSEDRIGGLTVKTTTTVYSRYVGIGTSTTTLLITNIWPGS